MTAPTLELLGATFTATEDDDDPAKAVLLPAEQQARIDKCRIIADGLAKLRAAGETYLPRLEGESPERYAIRQQYGALHPAPDLQIEGTIGEVLETEITFESDMPAEGVALWENVDGRGTGGVQYSREILRFALVDGFAGTFTDMPRADSPDLDRSRASAAAAIPGAPLDHADGMALGLRPYLVQVKAGQYHATYRQIGGRQVLARFVLREDLKVPVGEFGHRNVEQYRVYRQRGQVVTCELYRVPQEGTRAVRVPNTLVTLTNCDAICWSPLVLGPKMSDDTIKPPLELLFDLALQYYQVQNGMMSLSFEAFVATIVRVGALPIKTEVLPDGTIKLTFPPLLTGGGEVIEMPEAQAGGSTEPRIFYLQPNSDVLIPADQILTRIQGLIDMVCGSLYGTDVSGESGEAKKQKARGGNAWTGNVARAYKEMLELSWKHAMRFLGLKAGGINVKTSFKDITLSANEITAIGSLVAEGMDVKDAVKVLVLRGFFGPHADEQAISDAWQDNLAAKQAMEADAAQLKADALASNNATDDNLAA